MVTSPLRLRSKSGDIDRSGLQTDSYGYAARRYARSLPAYKRVALRQRSAGGKAVVLHPEGAVRGRCRCLRPQPDAHRRCGPAAFRCASVAPSPLFRGVPAVDDDRQHTDRHLDEPLRAVRDVAPESERVALLEQIAFPAMPVADFARQDVDELGSGVLEAR